MKKAIVMYIAWDIIFVSFFFAYSFVVQWELFHLSGTPNVLIRIFIPAVLSVLAGILICWLIHVSRKFEFTIKLAVLEFVIIGIPALLISLAMSMSFYAVYILYEGPKNMPLVFHILLSESPILCNTAGIVAGYELFMIIARIIKSRTTVHATEESSNNREINNP